MNFSTVEIQGIKYKLPEFEEWVVFGYTKRLPDDRWHLLDHKLGGTYWSFGAESVKGMKYSAPEDGHSRSRPLFLDRDWVDWGEQKILRSLDSPRFLYDPSLQRIKEFLVVRKDVVAEFWEEMIHCGFEDSCVLLQPCPKESNQLVVLEDF